MTLVLYHFPNACSQVTLFALDAAQADHDVRLVNLREEEQASAAYAQIAPLGKVPVLMIDRVPLTENGALLTYLDEAYPDAGLSDASVDAGQPPRSHPSISISARIDRHKVKVRGVIPSRSPSFFVVHPIWAGSCREAALIACGAAMPRHADRMHNKN